ncbi:DUF6265 family protein [Chitinimonas sp. BJYL2]|uniref:DUF6265 family protein n=1 Tax=Chitinimonas sp. BJYL2 TaxID=2976696 RepID=UPI0022B2B888|nr:DUF6265 family protein [Chitinimonas sp. BJYL2]
MKRLGWVCLSLLCLSVSASEPPRVKAEELAWLAGCWRQSAAESGSVEVWTLPAAGTLLGVSRTVRQGQLREFEFMRIHTLNDALHYTAQPSGRDETHFKLISGHAKALVFENPHHDFPQRVLYTLQADGGLLARIEGSLQGKPRARDFPMQRVKCEAN